MEYQLTMKKSISDVKAVLKSATAQLKSASGTLARLVLVSQLACCIHCTHVELCVFVVGVRVQAGNA